MACRADSVKAKPLEQRNKQLFGEFILTRGIEVRCELLALRQLLL